MNRIVRPRLTCACCERFVQAPLPSRPIERGRPGPGLLAHVLVSKYADHLPLYRQCQIFERDGLELNRSTLADWVGKSTALLEPLADAIGRHVLAAEAIFADDTPVSMLAPGTGRTQTARLWTYARDERPWDGSAPPAAWYRFSGDRKGQQVGLTIEPENAHGLMRAGTYLLTELDRTISVSHPELTQLNFIFYVMFRDIGDDGVVRTCTVLKPGRVDRSPCGTGSSANLATMHARGLVRKGDVLTSRSIIGSAFRVEVKDETVVGNRPAILPRVTGRAWIYGLSQIGLDPTDPFPRGFALSDTWGPYVGEL